jgi:hypothetical protein
MEKVVNPLRQLMIYFGISCACLAVSPLVSAGTERILPVTLRLFQQADDRAAHLDVTCMERDRARLAVANDVLLANQKDYTVDDAVFASGAELLVFLVNNFSQQTMAKVMGKIRPDSGGWDRCKSVPTLIESEQYWRTELVPVAQSMIKAAREARQNDAASHLAQALTQAQDAQDVRDLVGLVRGPSADRVKIVERHRTQASKDYENGNGWSMEGGENLNLIRLRAIARAEAMAYGEHDARRLPTLVALGHLEAQSPNAPLSSALTQAAKLLEVLPASEAVPYSLAVQTYALLVRQYRQLRQPQLANVALSQLLRTIDRVPKTPAPTDLATRLRDIREQRANPDVRLPDERWRMAPVTPSELAFDYLIGFTISRDSNVLNEISQYYHSQPDGRDEAWLQMMVNAYAGSMQDDSQICYGLSTLARQLDRPALDALYANTIKSISQVPAADGEKTRQNGLKNCGL